MKHLHWRRQPWRTGAHDPSTSNNLPFQLTLGLYYKNATHQLTNVTETHEKSLWKRIKLMHENACTCLCLLDNVFDTIATVQV